MERCYKFVVKYEYNVLLDGKMYGLDSGEIIERLEMLYFKGELISNNGNPILTKDYSYITVYVFYNNKCINQCTICG